MLVTFATLVIGAQAQINTVDIAGGGKLVPKTIEEKNEARMYETSASYPELVGINSSAASKFNDLVRTTVEQDVVDFVKAMLEMDEEELKTAKERGINNYSEISYTVGIATADMISLSFVNGNYTGGAHPNSYSYTINFDLKNGREILLQDLFQPAAYYLDIISAYAVADLRKQLGEDGDDEWITRGAGPEPDNFKSWYLTAAGLQINFDAYQVGPYVIGPQAVTVPISKLNSILRPEFATAQNTGNPLNWCRNGLFPKDSENFRLAKATGRSGEKVFFYGDDKDDCPGEKCKTSSYIIPGDQIIISKVYGDYACSWYQPRRGSETVGWIAIGKLSIDESQPTISVRDWLGNWSFNDSSIEISNGPTQGKLKITGNAFWRGMGDNIHIGELDDKAGPVGDKMNFGGDGEYDCRVNMQRLGGFLIVSDNLNCGGLNVSFNGVYQRK